VQLEGGRVEDQRLDERDDPGVQRNEVNDGPRDVGQRDVGSTASGRHGDPGHLLGLDAGGDHGVAEQRRRDVEALDHSAQALPERLTARAQHPQPAEQRQRSREPPEPRPFDRLGDPNRSTSPCQPHEPPDPPGYEDRALEPAYLAVQRHEE
jgi:hypothetical protein